MPNQTRATEARKRPSVDLAILGPTTLTVGSSTVNPGGKGQRSLLIRLALAEERLVTVDQLVEDLWGADAGESILSTLHAYVSRLRSVLGHPSRLTRMGPGYVLELSAEELDVRRFEALLDRGRQHVEGDPPRAVSLLDDALALWRGPALVDVSDRDWGMAAAVRLEGLRLSAVETRFDAMLAGGRHEQAVVELEEAVSAHPLRERFTSQLMIALYRSGRQTDALRHYERTRRKLADELGLDPSPALAGLEAAILAHEPWLRPPTSSAVVAEPTPPADTTSLAPDETPTATPATTVAATPPVASASPVPLPSAATRLGSRPFVGRADTLAALAEVWEKAVGGERQFVIIEGESGIGKTRVATRFAADAHAHGAIVLFGRATSDSIVPYAPLVEAMRALVRPLSEQQRHDLFAGRPGLHTLVPFLGDLGAPDDAVSTDSLADRYVMFETVAEVVSTWSKSWPIVLILDDLQWADPLTLRLLQYLLAHERPARLIVLGTMRTVPRVPNADLDALLADLQREQAVSRHRLRGLAEADVAALLGARGDGDAAARAASVLRATRGNPFFVTEIADHGFDDTLPRSVRDVLGVRLDRLSDAALRLVRAAALAGGVVPVSVLQAAAGSEPDELLDAIEEAIAAGLLVEEGGGSSAVTFRHAIVQQVVIEGIVLARRRAIHARLAAAYEGVKGAAMVRAHHLFEAGDLSSVDRLADAAVAAGREALSVFAYEDGVAWGERALALSDASPERRCAALLLVSDSRRALGDRREAHAAAREAADIACNLDDPSFLAAAAEALALVRAGIGFDFGVDDQGLDELLGEALRRLPATDVEQRSRLLEASLSNAAANQDLYALRGLSASALELAERHGQHALVATAHLAARMSVWRVEMLEQRLQSDFSAYQAADASGRLHLQLNALLYLVSDLEEAGRIDEGRRWFERVRDLAGRVRQPVYDAFVDFFDARVALLEGRYEDAGKLGDRALMAGLQSHGLNAEQAWAGLMFVRAWDHGELPGLLNVVELAARSAPHLPIWRVATAMCELSAGRVDIARAVLDELVVDGDVRHARDSLWYAAVALLTEVARGLDATEHAETLLAVMEPFSGRWTMTGLGRVSLGPLDRYLGVAAATAGRLDIAEQALARAELQCRAIGAKPHLARTLFDRATVVRMRGSADDAHLAREMEGEARGLADEIGLKLS